MTLSVEPAHSHPRPGDDLVIGLINNMPDAALEGTEAQFTGLLRAASGTHTLRLRYASLPEVPRGKGAAARIAADYWPLESLLAARPDALIVTGAEPKTAVLSDEPYWGRLAEVIDYAAAETISSVFSCLAAHAAVLHLDGIQRRRLASKRFGVYEQEVTAGPALTKGIGTRLHTPHSRWNDLPERSLRDAGYTILSRSDDAGVDAFMRAQRSLLLLFQGHPEYEDRTLLKEYQRDVGRYLAGEYTRYPLPPEGYLTAEALALVAEFEQGLRAGRYAEPSTAFPFMALAATVRNTWTASAVAVYRNWLDFIANAKAVACTAGSVR
jgi:homoserine O-succinyltransferase